MAEVNILGGRSASDIWNDNLTEKSELMSLLFLSQHAIKTYQNLVKLQSGGGPSQGQVAEEVMNQLIELNIFSEGDEFDLDDLTTYIDELNARVVELEAEVQDLIRNLREQNQSCESRVWPTN